MICDVVGGNAPFLTRSDTLRAVPMPMAAEVEITSAEALFTAWFLDLKKAGYQVILASLY
jgi:hypothetical protein